MASGRIAPGCLAKGFEGGVVTSPRDTYENSVDRCTPSAAAACSEVSQRPLPFIEGSSTQDIARLQCHGKGNSPRYVRRPGGNPLRLVEEPAGRPGWRPRPAALPAVTTRDGNASLLKYPAWCSRSAQVQR